MIREVKADRIAWLDSHSMSQPPRQIFNPCFHLSKRNLLSRRTIDKRDPIVTPCRGIVADLFPVKHERVDVRVGNIGNIPKWSLDNMIWIDLDTCHGGAGKVKRKAVGSESWAEKRDFMFGSRESDYMDRQRDFLATKNGAVRGCEGWESLTQ
jgi:hypothetical protein